MKLVFFNNVETFVDKLNEKLKNKKNMIAIKSNLASINPFLSFTEKPVIVIPILTNGSLPDDHEDIIPNLEVIIKNKMKEIRKKHLNIGSILMFPLVDIQIIAISSYFTDNNKAGDAKWILLHLHSFIFNVQQNISPEIIETLISPCIGKVDEIEEAFIKGIPPTFKAPNVEMDVNIIYATI